MNKRILHISLFLLLASTGNVLAQQGIGTNTPHRSAALEIDSENKGILIPRINITDANSSNPIAGTAPEGLMVYNKAEATGSIAEGFYYWANGKWNSFLTSLNSESTDTKTKLVDGNYTTVSLPPTNPTFLDNAINTYKVDVKVATKTTEEDGTFGVVKPGTGFFPTTDGTLNIDFPVTEDLNAITIVEKLADQEYVTLTSSPEPLVNTGVRTYTVGVNKATKPATGEATYGVVKIGSGFEETSDGTLNIDFPVNSITVSNNSTDNTLSTTVNNVTGNLVSLVKTNTLTLGTGNSSKQLTSTVNGISSTLDLSSIDTNTTYTAENGVHIDANNKIKLGVNPLTEATTITTNTHDFTIATTQGGATGKLKVSGLENTKQVNSTVTTTGNTSTLTNSVINKVLVVDANNTVKTVNAVMPEFFYMPSIVIDTQSTSVDLYQQYLNQFGNPMVSNTNNEGKLPVLNRNMLDYHVTYYDNTVLTNVSINNNGVMNYTVSNTPTNLTFINVVFKVRSTSNTVNP